MIFTFNFSTDISYLGIKLRSLYCDKNEFCFEKSKSRSQICKPFVKHSNIAEDKILILFLVLIIISCFLILFTDLLYLFLNEKSGVQQTKSKTLCFFVLIYAAGFSLLIQKTFDPSLFCAMNFQQRLCMDRRVPVYLKHGAFQTQNNAPLIRSSPCQFEIDRFVLGLFFLIIYCNNKFFATLYQIIYTNIPGLYVPVAPDMAKTMKI